MSTGMLFVNGIDAETLGFSPVSFEGHLGAPARGLNLLTVPGVPGGIDPGVSPLESTRRIVVNGLIKAASETAIHTALDVIKEACGTGIVEIRLPYSSTRVYFGVLEPFEAQQFTPTLINGYALFTLAFNCPMPHAIARTPSQITFGSTPVDIPLGTAPSLGRDNFSALITIAGAATTPTITYANYRGETVSSMAFSGHSPAAGDSILIDCGRRMVWSFVSGTKAVLFSALTAGYEFPALDPSDADVANSLWPKLSCSSGTANIWYWKHYR